MHEGAVEGAAERGLAQPHLIVTRSRHLWLQEEDVLVAGCRRGSQQKRTL